MKLHSQRQKKEDEQLLEADTSHIDMYSFELLSHSRCGTGVAAADELDDEGDEVECHERDCEDGGGDREN